MFRLFRGSGVPDPEPSSSVHVCDSNFFFVCKQARGVLDKTEDTEEIQVSTHQSASRKLLSTTVYALALGAPPLPVTAYLFIF